MNEEKNITGKDIIKVLLGNKWLYLLLAAVFFIVSFISLSVISGSKVEYVSYFDYDVAGFSTFANDAGEESTVYIDGEKFDTRTIVSEEKIKEYFSNNDELKKLDPSDLYKNNLIKSFTYTVKYKKNDHKMDEKDYDYIEEKHGYELVLNSNHLSKEQAKILSKSIANEVLSVTEKKIDLINYSSFLKRYDNSKSYVDKIANLIGGINYLIELENSLKDSYGDVFINNGLYGGESDGFLLASQTIDEWKENMESNFDTYYLSSLETEMSVNGFINPEATEYIANIKTLASDLDRSIESNESALQDLKTQRDNLVGSVGLNATVESLEIREYNVEIIELTKLIADQTKQRALYQLQLNKYNKVDELGNPLTDEQIGEYNASLNAFDAKLSNIRNDLEFYTKQYEAIAKSVLKQNMFVYFEDANIVSSEGEISILVRIGASFLIGLVAPILVNLALASFSVADGKPLFLKRRKEKI